MKQKLISAIIFGCLVSIFILNCSFAQAAALTSLSDTLTRLKKSTTANHTISFVTPSGIDVGDTVTLTFASDFDVSSVVVADVTIGGNQPASATVLGQIVTITADADTTVAPAGTATIVIGNSHITNATTAGSFTVSIGGTFGDTGSYAIAVADDDQVASSGTVDPTLNFNVTDGTVAFGTLSATAVKTDTATMTAATNSSSGYSITVNGNTLTSGANTITAIGGVAAASAPGTKQYGFKIGALEVAEQPLPPMLLPIMLLILIMCQMKLRILLEFLLLQHLPLLISLIFPILPFLAHILLRTLIFAPVIFKY